MRDQFAWQDGRPLQSEVVAEYLKLDPVLAGLTHGGVTLGRIRLPHGKFPLTIKVREHGRIPSQNGPFLHEVVIRIQLGTSYEGDEKAPVAMGMACRRVIWLLDNTTINSRDIPALASRPVLSLPSMAFRGAEMADAERIDSPEEVIEIEFTTGGEKGA